MDIKEARNNIRLIVEPLKLKLSSYTITETLGCSSFFGGSLKEASDPKHWHDDEVQFNIEIEIWPSTEYPGDPHNYGYGERRLHSTRPTREEAIADIHQQVLALVPGWEKAHAEDKQLASWVGCSVKTCRAEFIQYHDENGNKHHCYTVKGSVAKIVKHKPGWVYIQYPEPYYLEKDGLWIRRRSFFSGYTRQADNVFVPDPDYKLLPDDPRVTQCAGEHVWGIPTSACGGSADCLKCHSSCYTE